MNTPINPSNFLLLIVDDLPTNLRVLNGILSIAGYQMSFANNGQQALERVGQISPDLILLDLMMPDMDGLEVADIMAQNPQYREIPIIFLTASHEQENLTKAFEKGAVDYLTKPFNKEELLARIKTHLQLKTYRDFLSYQVKQEKLIKEITQAILSDLELEKILHNTVAGLQTLFQADRVIIESYEEGNQSQRIVGNFPKGNSALYHKIIKDWIRFDIIQKELIKVIDLRDLDNLTPLQEQRLMNWDVQTELIASIMLQNELWGILMIHHCTNSYQWSEQKIQSLQQIIQQTQIAIQQAELYAKLQTANQQLERLAYYDGLTQIPNRRQFDITIQQEWLRLRRDKQPLSLIMCDVDYFKQYNTLYGHQGGDVCLFKVAQAIEKTIRRPADSVNRYGGEEFAVILPYTNQEGAIQLAQMIKAVIAQLEIPHKSSPHKRVSLSMGIATMIPDTKTHFQQLIEFADQALYQAKKQGRNQWQIA